jgi:hypothetical protein
MVAIMWSFFCILHQMGCPALGIWVCFLKQPALPGEAPPKKNSSKKKIINKKSQMNQK